jgi:ribosomal protein S10
MTFKITIVGYNKFDIQEQINLLTKVFKLKPTHFSKKSSLITMLRAPQINKSSREQFALAKYKQVFEITFKHR